MSENSKPREGLATIAEVAEYLQMSRAHVYQLLDLGLIKYARLKGRGERCSRRIPWVEVERYVSGSMTAGVHASPSVC